MASDDLDRLRTKLPYPIQFALWGIARWFRGLAKDKRMDVIVAMIVYVMRMEFLDGYRSYIGGVGFVFTGLGAILELAGNPDSTVATAGVLAGLGGIMHGISVIGDAGKKDKQIEATKAAAVLQVALAPDPPTPTAGTAVNNAAIDKAMATLLSPTNAISTPVPTDGGKS